uniref:Uncharacterized protein n=1 Tax=Meloidogyne enterolobii TaxID=390850 RepID=A0A6V7VHV4_MELEN|nr:unnamed protein product [Meloidogyne enterolobii]
MLKEICLHVYECCLSKLFGAANLDITNMHFMQNIQKDNNYLM